MNSNPWSERLVQVFDAPVPALESPMAQTIGEGLLLSNAAAAIAAAATLTWESTTRARRMTSSWLGMIMRRERLPEDLEWLAVPGTLLGTEALLGAWDATHGRLLQVAATHERIHLRSRITPPLGEAASDEEKLAVAVGLANELLLVEMAPFPSGWQVGRLGDSRFVWACRLEARDEPRRWDETLLVVTDGTGVKLSIQKIREGASPPKAGFGRRDLSPWFSTEDP
jgi:hypothetical protein